LKSDKRSEFYARNGENGNIRNSELSHEHDMQVEHTDCAYGSHLVSTTVRPSGTTVCSMQGPDFCVFADF